MKIKLRIVLNFLYFLYGSSSISLDIPIDSNGFLGDYAMPLSLFPTETMLYAANPRILWTAIVIPVCLSVGLQAFKLGEWNRPAVSAHVDGPEPRETFVPNPNQPPVFTRGFGTR